MSVSSVAPPELAEEAPEAPARGSAGWSDAMQWLRNESLPDGLLLLLTLAIAQRGVGFVRNILFCRWLSDEQLGHWGLAFSFLLTAAPLAVLGLPGSFGRFVERYRQQGLLGFFLRSTGLVSLAGTLLLAGSAFIFAEPVAAWLLNAPTETTLVRVAAVGLISVAAFNFLIELFTALRQARVVSLMQASNSLLFAVCSLGLLAGTQLGAVAVVTGYCLACLASAVLGFGLAYGAWDRPSELQEPTAPPDTGSLWSSLLPFAGWIWTANLLSNLFEVSDRWMIVHFAPGEHSAALVGQYQSSSVAPYLLISLATMMGTLLLPHLTKLWEANQKPAAYAQINLSLKLSVVLLTGGAAGILLLGPAIFGWLLGGRYDAGLAILPWTLVYCVWSGVAVVARNHLWLTEAGRWSTATLIVGLVANVLLNLLWLPQFGLFGAVWATAAGNAVALAAAMLVSWRLGMPWDRGSWLLLGLPLCLAGGPWIATLGLVLTGLIAMGTDWLLDADERDLLLEQTHGWLARARGLAAPFLPQPPESRR